MLRLMNRAGLTLGILVIFASVSLAQNKGGISIGSGRGAGGRISTVQTGGLSKGSGNSVLPTTSSTKVVATRIAVGQTIDPKTVGKVVETRVTRVIDTKLTKVVETKTTQVIDPKTGQVVVTRVTQVVDTKVGKVVPGNVSKVVVGQVIPGQVTQVIPHQVIVSPIVGGFGWGHCGCGCGCCGCGWFTEVLTFLGFEPPAAPVQYERYLRLHNDTDEKITVYLRHHTEDVTGQWDWVPEAPGPTATKWLAFEMQPNEVLEPKLGEMFIAANRIRLYAESATKSWLNYKDQDYWLVPETTTSGEHLYYAPSRQTYQFYIHNNTK